MPHVTVHTLDPHTRGTITRNNATLDEIPFDFRSEDADEWERLADEALEAAGWVRTGPWAEQGYAPTAPVSPAALYVALPTLRGEGEVNAILLEGLDGYDRDQYAPDLAAGNARELAREEWANLWSKHEGAFVDEADARAYAAAENDAGRRLKVVHVTFNAVTAALKTAFGDE